MSGSPSTTPCAKAIAERCSVDEIKEIRDRAKALEVYANEANNLEVSGRLSKSAFLPNAEAGTDAAMIGAL